nr:MAG TPA: hypothetical protein [Caudoviricetes sp.]
MKMPMLKSQKKLLTIVVQFKKLCSRELEKQYLFLFSIQWEDLFQMRIIIFFGLDENLNYMLDLQPNNSLFKLMVVMLIKREIFFGSLKAFI